MKILQINKFHYIRGGSDKMYFEISSLLEENGHKVIHFSTKSEKNRPSPTSDYFVNNPEFLKLSVKEKLVNSYSYIYSKEAAHKLDLLLEKEKPQIAHLHIFFGELSLSILPVLRKHHIPVVMSLHEYKLLCPVYTLLDNNGEICEKCCGGNYIHSLTKRCNKGNFFFSGIAALESTVRDLFYSYSEYIDKFIAVSKFSMEKHLQYKPTLKNKLTYLHNFTSFEDLSEKVHVGEYFIYFGRLSKEKGLYTLLKAFSYIKDTQLLIVGDGPMRAELEKYVKSEELENIEFVGFKTGEELNKLISHAGFSIVPSEWYETFGLTIVESMKNCTPVISTGLGGMKELVQEGFNGFNFEAKNFEDLISVIKKAKSLSKEEYIQMASNCNKFARENFQKDKYYIELMSIYNKLITRG